jgi:hypothetical protein
MGNPKEEQRLTTKNTDYQLGCAIVGLVQAAKGQLILKANFLVFI